jgi:hypothetical protein
MEVTKEVCPVKPIEEKHVPAQLRHWDVILADFAIVAELSELGPVEEVRLVSTASKQPTMEWN